MQHVKLKSRLAAELPKINSALDRAITELPLPCQEAASHILSAGGKRLRPFLAVLFARISGITDDRIYRLASTMEMLHAATLLHDDILDQAHLRRGKLTAHTLFGNAATILTGDALLALGNAIIAEHDSPALSKIYSLATMETAAGEILEMSSLHNPETTEQEYLAIAQGKTACLIAQSCALGTVFGSNDASLGETAANFGLNLGIAFQLVDDALDFMPESQTGKPSGGDLREGKLTIPLFLYRQSLAPAEKEDFDVQFKSAAMNPRMQIQICDAIKPFVDQSLTLADDYLARAVEYLKIFPHCEETELLAALPHYIRNRTN